MPELPEVETIANGLRMGGSGQPSILGMSIASAQVFWARTIATPDPAAFISQLPGQRIERISRRAKYLLLHLSKDHLIIHLRMSGDLRLEPQTDPIPPHHRLLLTLQDGWRLGFNDTRKFGRVWLTPDPQSVLAGLGPEPFDPAFTPAEFYARLHKTHRLVKPLLLDQTFIAGLGNIYTDEALHRSGLHPLRPAHTLSPEDASLLLANIREVLSAGILHHGASIDWVYRGGDFQKHFRVYKQQGKPCRTCGAPIERIFVGQRSTHFCPRCQPAPEA